jgi:hypothetical protein
MAERRRASARIRGTRRGAGRGGHLARTTASRHLRCAAEVGALFEQPLGDRLYRAQTRQRDANRVQIGTPLSIKAGGCMAKFEDREPAVTT